ncbi:MAG: helix-turn-helix transcriptional regulator [Clostridiales bacterium]|nr:helix-turn-helix transcriptional regulator [Clostridiales bacterium]
MVNFGNRLRELRDSKKMTQKQLAERLGLTKSVISAYETSMRYPSYDVLVRIASIFRVSTDYLLGMEQNRTIDVTGLSIENERLIYQLIEALRTNPDS